MATYFSNVKGTDIMMVRVNSLGGNAGVRFGGYIPDRVSTAFKRWPWCMDKQIQSRGAGNRNFTCANNDAYSLTIH
jgi:hypothetical protein